LRYRNLNSGLLGLGWWVIAGMFRRKIIGSSSIAVVKARLHGPPRGGFYFGLSDCFQLVELAYSALASFRMGCRIGVFPERKKS